MIKRMKN